MPTKVACPKCQAGLKSAKELAPGRNVTCPRCQTAFVVPGGEIAKGAPPAMGILVPATPSFIRTPPSDNGPSGRPSALDPVELSLEPPRKHSTLMLLVVGTCLVLGGGALLVYFCFLGDGKRTAEAEEYFELPE